MQRRQNFRTTFLLGMISAAVFPLEGQAFAQDAMKVRPGFGYTIDFMTGPAAESLLPAARKEAMVCVRVLATPSTS